MVDLLLLQGIELPAQLGSRAGVGSQQKLGGGGRAVGVDHMVRRRTRHALGRSGGRRQKWRLSVQAGQVLCTAVLECCRGGPVHR